jgi:hypothetical protein
LIRLENNSLISTSVLDSNGGGGNIAINNSNLILARNNSDIRANAKFAILPENIVDPTGLLTASCPISDENNFAITGNDGNTTY